MSDPRLERPGQLGALQFPALLVQHSRKFAQHGLAARSRGTSGAKRPSRAQAGRLSAERAIARTACSARRLRALKLRLPPGPRRVTPQRAITGIDLRIELPGQKGLRSDMTSRSQGRPTQRWLTNTVSPRSAWVKVKTNHWLGFALPPGVVARKSLSLAT